jgi:TolB-like protein/DNA-binding winged helix-turn-helix (wHTH) protein
MTKGGAVGELARIKIGPWTATPALNMLERDGRSIKIESRAMDVLAVLARHGGAVVSVEELLASVWKGVVVGDGSVYLAIRQLRQALDDPADGTRYIETIPKRGYRLTAAANREPTPAPVTTQASSRRPMNRSFPRRFVAVAFVGAAIVAGIVFALRDGVPPGETSSVAVLPFENLSSDPEQEYFADGVTAEILNALSRVRDLHVTGPSSSFRFKDRDESLSTIGATLGVDHVLEGSVRKAGDRVRITAQLSSARTGRQLWSERYERTLDDIFLIQDEIAKAVANALQLNLGVGDLGRMPGMTDNVAAYEEYLRGTARLAEGRPESLPLAIAHLQRAVALDPSFSIGWGTLGMAYSNGALAVPAKTEEWRRQSDEAVELARALTPDAPHVLLVSGVAESRRGRWLEAASIFERLEASYSRYGMTRQAWEPRGVFLAFVGRLREATPVLEHWRAEEPLKPQVAIWLSLAYTAEGNFAMALAEIDRGLKLEHPGTPLLGAGLLIALNKQDRVEIHKRLRALPDRDRRGLMPFVDEPAGAAAEIRHQAATADPSLKTALAYWAAYFQEPELSLQLWSEGTRDAAGLWQPIMRDVRRLPAFKGLVQELGLVEYWRAYGWSDFCHPIGEHDFACS